jgi:hypothetical protein
MPTISPTRPLTQVDRDREAYHLRVNQQESWAFIVQLLNFNNESTARLSASRHARVNNLPPLTAPNPRRSQAGRLAAQRRFNIQPGAVQRILNPQVQQTSMRTFGVEIEYVNMDRRVVADKVALALGVQHIHVLPYHGKVCETCNAQVSGYTEWKVERDGSVYSGGEVISPILQGEDGFVQIKKVMKAIKEAGGGVSRSCGLHVHLGVRDMTKEQRAELVGRWYANETMIKHFVSRSRWTNTYCKTVAPAEVTRWQNLILAGRDPQKHEVNRTSSLNITPFPKAGTYEVRLHQGSLNAKKISAWVKFLVAFVDFTAAEKELVNESGEMFGVLDTLVKPLDTKQNLFTEADKEYLKARATTLTGGQ